MHLLILLDKYWLSDKNLIKKKQRVSFVTTLALGIL